METSLIHDRGRGPEIVGTRITVYNLMPHLLDPTATEESICRRYDLTLDQVAAARAYVLNHADTVLAKYAEIEDRLGVGNPPEVIEQAKKTHERFQSFKRWLAARNASTTADEDARNAREPEHAAPSFPSFREWLNAQESRHSHES
jgi:uncharacterized protein (DUF433 family)